MNINDVKDDDAVVVCNPTYFENHVDNVTKQKCDFCGDEVWLSESTKKAVTPGKKLYISCLDCAMPHIEKEPIQLPTDEQLMEVAQKVGKPFEQVKAEIHSAVKARNMSLKYESN